MLIAVPVQRAVSRRDAVAVSIRGYGGDAMEPFVAPDGRYRLFNNVNG